MLSSNPFTNKKRTVSKFCAGRFCHDQEAHSVSIHQRYITEFESYGRRVNLDLHLQLRNVLRIDTPTHSEKVRIATFFKSQHRTRSHSNYAWYQCKSEAIRKRLKGLRMIRSSFGEISGIVEFSTAITVSLLRTERIEIQLRRPKTVLVNV